MLRPTIYIPSGLVYLLSGKPEPRGTDSTPRAPAAPAGAGHSDRAAAGRGEMAIAPAAA